MGFIDRTSLELLFKKVMKAGESQVMDLETFFDALDELSAKLYASDPSKFNMLVSVMLSKLK
jgi:hypothetical protein